MILKESGEMYLETIYVLLQSSKEVRAIHVAEKLGYSKPSVSRAMGLLKNGGLISIDKEGFISLTTEGLQTAEALYERHTVLSKILMALGIDEETATLDACRIEHVISETSFEAMKRHLAEQMK